MYLFSSFTKPIKDVLHAQVFTLDVDVLRFLVMVHFYSFRAHGSNGLLHRSAYLSAVNKL